MCLLVKCSCNYASFFPALAHFCTIFVALSAPVCDRRLWQNVTMALKEGNIDTATEHKHCLEERQRNEERQRLATNTPWKPKHFIKEVRPPITNQRPASIGAFIIYVMSIGLKQCVRV